MAQQPPPIHHNADRKTPQQHSLSVLTVGDGDFSCSLALKRAYYPHLISSITATTLLPSKEKLIETYPQTAGILQELIQDDDDDVTIMYGVDATRLQSDHRLLTTPHKISSFDLISFHHPHLGYDDNQQYDMHRKHAVLIRDYLQSSMSLLCDGGGYIHLCVTAGSIEKWKIPETAQDLELEIQCDSPFVASKPMLEYFTSERPTNDVGMEEEQQNNDDNSSSNTSLAEQKVKDCLRAKRKGHWLGKFGYRHQPTYPQDTQFQNPNKSNSVHIFFSPRNKERNYYSAGRKRERDCTYVWINDSIKSFEMGLIV